MGNTNYDITSRVLMEKERERLLVEINSKNQDLESLIHTLSHDVRAPLVNMQGFSRELGLALGDLRAALPAEMALDALAEVEQCRTWIDAAAARLEMVAGGVIRYARLGRMEFDVKEMEIAPIWEAAVEIEKSRLVEANALIAVGELPSCRADSDLLAQVFANLIDNSIKYRRPDLRLRLYLAGHRAADQTVLVYTDNGRGIEAPHREKVFELFHRLEPHGDAPGEGMGLTLVRRSLQRIGGSIAIVDGPADGGCTFVIRLPAP